MLAWYAPFQTKTEQILWRMSTPTMMGYGVLIWGFDLWNISCHRTYFGTYYYAGKLKLLFKPSENEEREFPHFVAKALMGVIHLFHNFLVVIVSCATLLYLLARVYLVVERFLSLFHSPPGLFRQPKCGPYFPQIS